MDTNLNQLLQERGIPDWARTRLEQMPLLLPDHYDKLSSSAMASVDLADAVGCRHPDYFGSTWLELLGEPGHAEPGHLKRLESNMRDMTMDGGAYYLSRSTKSNWSFAVVDGRLYIDSGMHRSVLGRFLLELNGSRPVVHGVHVSHWVSRRAAVLVRTEAVAQEARTLLRRLMRRLRG